MSAHHRPAVFLSHIPRSGGTSLVQFLAHGIPRRRRYPDPTNDADMIAAKTSAPYLLRVPRARLERTDLFCPHIPVAAASLLGLKLFTLTIVREPVARMRSVLATIADGQPGRGGLEGVYAEDDWARSWFVAHQLCYYLAPTGEQLRRLTASDAEHGPVTAEMYGAERYRAVLGREDEMIASACRTVEALDAVGVTEQSEDLYAELAVRLDLRAPEAPLRAKAAPAGELPPGLRRRLEETTAADREIYEFTRALVGRRRAEAQRRTTSFSS